MKPLKEIEERITPYIESGITSQFFKHLSDGTLKREQYDDYLLQDNIYLGVYKLALDRIANQTDCVKEATFFKEAAGSINLEPAKKNKKHHLSQANPNSLNYIDYLLTYCHTDIASAIASVYACFYFYHTVARELKPKNDAHPYSDWFTCYTGNTFSSQTQTITGLVNDHFDKVDNKDGYLDIIEKGFELECDFHGLEEQGA